ncbi:oligoribonuclease [Coxiella-like endosymbiont of Amblyomma americanum]|uniref:oligoribonuclease n=1 Tax=Coxiella-like endosymbiont of Amblyomma americanum TaxID=1987500 RepID=UPI000F89DE44|nr:oligoribonuclease [Coxiella-like endosymbiont of Amblyomma americanum]AUJ58952.1 oligoribonuclease [Coxiella-like endosymbiont of Amblyomma americanum]
MMFHENNFVWLDLEMTGLNPDANRILEIATIVTNNDLDYIAEGPVFAIHQSNEWLEKMDHWNISHHTASGLIERVKKSKVTDSQAEIETLNFLKKYVPPKKSPLCGNSVCQDRRFLYRYMPSLSEFFHYRHLDVTTIRIFVQRWFSQITVNAENKSSKHTASQDVRDSIAELRYYRKHLLRI